MTNVKALQTLFYSEWLNFQALNGKIITLLFPDKPLKFLSPLLLFTKELGFHITRIVWLSNCKRGIRDDLRMIFSAILIATCYMIMGFVFYGSFMYHAVCILSSIHLNIKSHLPMIQSFREVDFPRSSEMIQVTLLCNVERGDERGDEITHVTIF